MENENETRADIVKSLRDGTIYDENGCFDSHEIADRLDAAAKREDGNAAKMREALVRVKRLFDGRLMWQPDIRKAHEVVNAALAAPPRNCDVGTEREQHVRFTNYCNAHGDCVDFPIKAEWHKALSCGILWAQMPYDAKESGVAE